jgi:hypothetical protein
MGLVNIYGRTVHLTLENSLMGLKTVRENGENLKNTRQTLMKGIT